MPDLYTTGSLLSAIRKGLLDIGYHSDLLRENYAFAEVFGDDTYPLC